MPGSESGITDTEQAAAAGGGLAPGAFALTSDELAGLDILLMRKDPPFDMDYVYSTYILDLAERAGVTEFTARLADGLDTSCGERGIRLSGGQRRVFRCG